MLKVNEKIVPNGEQRKCFRLNDSFIVLKKCDFNNICLHNRSTNKFSKMDKIMLSVNTTFSQTFEQDHLGICPLISAIKSVSNKSKFVRCLYCKTFL